MSGILMLVIGLAGQWFLGIAVAMAVLAFRRNQRIVLVEWIGLGFVLGIGTTSWLLLIWSLCGGPLGTVPSLLLTFVGFAIGVPLFLARLHESKRSYIARSGATSQLVHEKALCQLCQLGIAVLFVASLVQTVLTPQKLWDERAIFAIKATVLYEDRSLCSPSLTHPDFVQYHPRYPLLLPLAEEHVYSLVGAVDDRLSKVVFAELYWGLILTFAGVLQRRISAGAAWLSACVLATVPVLAPYEYGFACGQADAPVACFHGLSALYLWNGLPRRNETGLNYPSIGMAGLLASLAAFTKDEGIAYLIIDTTILAVFSAGSLFQPARLRSYVTSLMLFVVVCVVLLSPWFVHRKRLPATTEMNYFGRMSTALFFSRLDTLNWSVPHLLRRMFWEWREWGLQWWSMLLTTVGFPGRVIRQPQLFLAGDVLGSLASLLVAGMLAPAQLDEHIGGSSHRFLMQIAPVAILFAATVYFQEDQEQADDRPR